MGPRQSLATSSARVSSGRKRAIGMNSRLALCAILEAGVCQIVMLDPAGLLPVKAVFTSCPACCLVFSLFCLVDGNGRRRFGAMNISLSEINVSNPESAAGSGREPRGARSARPESVELHDVWSNVGTELPKGCCYSRSDNGATSGGTLNPEP